MLGEGKRGCIAAFQTELKLRGFKVTQEETRQILEAFIDTVQDYVRDGKALEINGLGKFYIDIRSARTIHSNLTNGNVYVPEAKKLKFKPSKVLVRVLNNTETDGL